MKKAFLRLALGAVLLALCVRAEAQHTKKIYRVGYLSPRPGIDSRAEAFRQGLASFGYVEGNNLVLEWRFVSIAYDIAGKRLELLKETMPNASRAAVLVDPSPAAEAHVRETERSARILKMQLRVLEVRAPAALDSAFQAVRQGQAEVLSVVTTGLINSHRPRIINLAASSRLPTIYSSPDFVLEGGLMSYASDPVEQSRRAATYVDKILKGAKPADLPVEQPKKFEFIVNLKAAKQIGVTIPPNVLARADRIIR